MKILKAIFYTLMGLILLLCAGMLICALTPSLTEKLAEKVENLSSPGIREDYSPAESLPQNDTVPEGIRPGIRQPGNVQTGTDGTQDSSITGQPGLDSNQTQDGTPTSYEPPDSSTIEAPASVSGRTGYEPVREEAEQIPSEQADSLSESVPLGNIGSDLTFDEEFYPYYAMLEPDMQQLYRQIYANALELTQSFSPVVPVNVNQLKTVFEAVYNDHPELFWLETGYSCKYLRNGSCVEITLKYNACANNLEQTRQEFESRAGQILQVANTLGSDLEKELFVHDSLMHSIEYVLNAPMNQSAYSALVAGRTVCAGYARAFQYLMQQLGIPCYYCTGFAGEDHAWNIIKLGNDYYNVDVTWDDTDPSTYDYYNKTDREFRTNHARTGLSVYLPACVTQMEQPANPESDAGSGEDPTVNGASAEEPDDISAYINSDPVEPLRWVSSTGEYLDTDPLGVPGSASEAGDAGTENGTGSGETGTGTGAGLSQEGTGNDTGTGEGTDTGTGAEAGEQDALERAGITEEEVLDTLQEYYDDCEAMLKTVGRGDCQFTNVIPSSLWSAVEQAYNSGAYRQGYADDALAAIGADSYVIHLQVQDLGGGYWRLYHNVYTE